jgi:beta-lactam-binding protein with PASTA domain
MSFFSFLKSKSFFIQLSIAVLGLFAIIFGLQYWLNKTTNHDQKIQVPNLERLSLSEVEQKLNQLDLAYKIIDSASYNPTYPKRSVIEQTPEAGDFVKEKRKIYLTLNPSKYRDVTIPDLNGRTKRQATSQLKSIGFHVDTTYTYVKDIGKDVVRGLKNKGQEINAGEKLPLNSKIQLILGDGNR